MFRMLTCLSLKTTPTAATGQVRAATDVTDEPITFRFLQRQKKRTLFFALRFIW